MMVSLFFELSVYVVVVVVVAVVVAAAAVVAVVAAAATAAAAAAIAAVVVVAVAAAVVAAAAAAALAAVVALAASTLFVIPFLYQESIFKVLSHEATCRRDTSPRQVASCDMYVFMLFDAATCRSSCTRRGDKMSDTHSVPRVTRTCDMSLRQVCK